MHNPRQFKQRILGLGREKAREFWAGLVVWSDDKYA